MEAPREKVGLLNEGERRGFARSSVGTEDERENEDEESGLSALSELGEGSIDGEAAADALRSCGGRGDMGTFQITASSGTSSSESWHSSSNSAVDLRFGCQELRRGLRTGEGPDRTRGVLEGIDIGDSGQLPGCVGDGDLDRCFFARVMASEGAEGLVRPLLPPTVNPNGLTSRIAPSTWLFKLGNLGRF